MFVAVIDIVLTNGEINPTSIVPGALGSPTRIVCVDIVEKSPN